MSRARLRIDTPEGLTLEVAVAGLGERFAALVADLALLCVVYAACAVLFSLALDAPALIVLAGFVVRHGYFVLFESRWQGQTPGKRLLGLKVVQRDAGPLDARGVLARNLVRDIELLIPLLLFVVLNRHRMRAGDFVAGTVVVRLPTASLQPDEAHATRQLALDIAPRHLAIYGAYELEALAQILREVDPHSERGHVLVTRLAQTIAQKVGLPEAVTGDADGFLRTFYGAQRAHLERQQLHGRHKADKHERSS